VLGASSVLTNSYLVLSSTRKTLSPEAAALGMTSAAALGGAGAAFSLRGRISKIYLADAALEALLIASWAVARTRRETTPPHEAPTIRRSRAKTFHRGHYGKQSSQRTTTELAGDASYLLRRLRAYTCVNSAPKNRISEE
jgi:hypothetical protein